VADLAINYGYDTSCTDSLRTGRFASGVRLVAEAIYRRLITPRGALRGGDDEANYGFDLIGKLGHTVSASEIAALPGQVEAEILKDERIESADISVNSVTTGPSVAWTITVSAVTGLGPFQLVLGVNGVTAQLLSITTS
jgi:hypothetical protein